VAVAVVSRGKEAVDQAVAAITARGGRAIGLTGDTSDWASIERVANGARDQLGAIDILLNNTGGPPPSRIIGTAPELWEAQFKSMVLVFFRLTDMLLPDMRARKWGRVINIESESVVQPIPQIAISNTLRGAMVGWAKTLAGEVARDGVTVNTLLPGAFATDRVLSVQRAQGVTQAEAIERIARNIPVGRMGTPEEFGAMAAFIASPLAGYITGSMIRLDGGSIRSI
jgi:3-oxoacyl-[acyl-carrier protein] reductase